MPLDPNGYTADTLTEIIDSMSETAVSEFGSNIDTTENSVLGILMGIIGIQIEQQGQIIQELYSNMDPDSAEGKSLDNIAYTNGLIRKAGSKSTVAVTFTNDSVSTVTVEAQTRVTSSNGSEFFTQNQLVILAGATGNTSATASEEGELEAAADSITTYTPTIADVSVTNPDVASTGTSVESDTQLRQRVYRFLNAGGNSTLDAIAAQVSNITGVTDVLVVENDTFEDQSRGDTKDPRPPKSFEVVVEGGADQDIVDVILATKPAGIQAFGSIINGLATFVQGATRLIGFTRPSVRPLFVRITYSVYCEETFPVNGEDAIANHVTEFGATEYTLGKDIIAQRLIAAAHTAGVPGLASVVVTTSFTTEFTLATRTMQVFERAELSKINITFIKV